MENRGAPSSRTRAGADRVTDQQTHRKRKKPCPYCQKRLVATCKAKWRYNLARHLANTCQPYQRENLALMTRTICKLLEAFLPDGMTRVNLAGVDGYMKTLNTRAEISELERIAKL